MLNYLHSSCCDRSGAGAQTSVLLANLPIAEAITIVESNIPNKERKQKSTTWQ